MTLSERLGQAAEDQAAEDLAHLEHRNERNWTPRDECPRCQQEMAMLGEADRSRVAALEGIKALPGDPLARAESLLLGAELEAALGQEYRARLQAELAAGWLEVARLRAQQLIPARTAPLASPQVHSRSQT